MTRPTSGPAFRALVALVLAAGALRGEPLELAIRYQGERLVRRVIPDSDPATVFDVGVGRVEVRKLPDDQWQLEVTPARAGVLEIGFPFAFKPGGSDRFASGAILYPHWLGVSVTTGHRGPWDWWGLMYPGEAFAPLMIWTSGTEATLVAAQNWPPQLVRPMFCESGLSLDYRVNAEAGRRFTLTCSVAAVKATDGRAAWQVAVDRYRAWLRPRMEEAGLKEPVLPPRLQRAAGWLNVQLENIRSFDPGELRNRCRRWSEVFPWVQFWGQMSHYAGPPHLTDASRRPDEEVGCCLARPELHDRYAGVLPRLARELAAEGWVGYYTRPEPDARLDVEGEGRRFLGGWLERSRNEWNGNAFYVDTLGGHPYGTAPLEVARFVASLPQPLVIEGAVDIYPTAALVSGSLKAGTWNGGPDQCLARLPEQPTTAVFPSLGRYLMRERLFFLGQSNRDHQSWGGPHAYWTERQAFLLGAKFDVMNPEDSAGERERLNRAVSAAVQAWGSVSFWERNALYDDKRGVSEEPAGVDVRRFMDARGRTLLAIDNWRQVRGRVLVDGREVPLPEQPLAMIELAATEGGP